MRKHIAAFALAVAGLSAPAFSADVYTDDVIVTSPNYERVHEAYRANRSGFYVGGSIGIANGERTVERQINRQIDLNVDDPAFAALVDTDNDGTITDAEREAASAALSQDNIPHTINDNSAVIPLIADQLKFGRESDFDSMVFGGEVSYLYHVPGAPVGFEIGLGTTFYNDSKTSLGHTDQAGQYQGGTALADADFGGGPICGGVCAGDPSPFPQTGITSIERNYDIDLTLKGHWFLTPRFAVNVFGGPSWAQATLSGVNDSGDERFNTAFEKDKTSLGFVVGAGVDFWATEQIRIGGSYDFKRHDWGNTASNSATEALDGPDLGVSLGGSTSDRVKAEDDVHTFKVKASIKLN